MPQKRKCFNKEKPPKECLTRQKSKRLINKSRRVKTTRYVKYRNSTKIESDKSSFEEIPKKRFSCPECNFTTARITTLVQHKQSHSLHSILDCSICKQTCKSLKALKKHERLHSLGNQYQCENCSSAFKQGYELFRHIRYKHTHEKPFKCTKCDSAYVERSKLIRHMSKHSDTSSYQCLQCSFTSPTMHKLQRHLRTHVLRKPYKCTFCTSCFATTNSLKAHIKQIHQKMKHYCTTCFLDFNSWDDLENHMQKLHRNIELLEEKIKNVDKFPQEIRKTYECNDCGLDFTQIRNLISHVMICDRKPAISRNISDSEQKLSEFHAIRNSKTSSELMTISNYLIRGEIILLPAMDDDKYVMINIITEDKNQQSSDDYQSKIKKEMIDDWGSDLEWDSSEIKLENSEIKEEIVDEEIEPFYGFDLSNVQIDTMQVR